MRRRRITAGTAMLSAATVALVVGRPSLAFTSEEARRLGFSDHIQAGAPRRSSWLR